MTPNIAAFLAMLSHSEGTDRSADPYRVCYGFVHVIADLSYHPAERRGPDNAIEWGGESIAHLGPQYAGKVSTAAGRYQINLPTWLDFKSALSLGDFSQASQNYVAIGIIRRAGALDDIRNGDIADGILKCRAKWASLPGGQSGQPERSLADLIDRYSAAGGALV